MTVPNDTKLRGIVARRATCLPDKSPKVQTKRHMAQPLGRSDMISLVPIMTVPAFEVSLTFYKENVLPDLVAGVAL